MRDTNHQCRVKRPNTTGKIDTTTNQLEERKAIEYMIPVVAGRSHEKATLMF
jgi:hypothetical protein